MYEAALATIRTNQLGCISLCGGANYSRTCTAVSTPHVELCGVCLVILLSDLAVLFQAHPHGFLVRVCWLCKQYIRNSERSTYVISRWQSNAYTYVLVVLESEYDSTSLHLSTWKNAKKVYESGLMPYIIYASKHRIQSLDSRLRRV